MPYMDEMRMARPEAMRSTGMTLRKLERIPTRKKRKMRKGRKARRY
jgi:hypothetical protein